MSFTISIINKKTKATEHVIATGKDIRSAERIQRGASINLDTKRYYVSVDPDKEDA